MESRGLSLWEFRENCRNSKRSVLPPFEAESRWVRLLKESNLPTIYLLSAFNPHSLHGATFVLLRPRGFHQFFPSPVLST